MRLDHLSIKDFLGHADTDIDFRQTPMVAITGPVGSGKSSIIDAFTWAVWGESRARGRQFDPLIREGSESCTVEAMVFHESSTFHIVRKRAKGGTSSLVFEESVEDGAGVIPLTKHSLKETQAVINETFGMDWDGMTAGPIALQGAAGLMVLQPRERKELLQTLMVPGDWDAWYDIAHKRAASATADIERLSREIIVYPEAGVMETRLQSLREEVAQGTSNLTDEHTRVNEAREDLTRAREDLATANAAAQEAVLLREQADENHRRYVEQGELDLAYTQRVANAKTHRDGLKEKEAGGGFDAEAHARAKTAMTTAMQAATVSGQALAELRTQVKHAGEEVTCPNCDHAFHPGAADYPALVEAGKEAAERFAADQQAVTDTQTNERTIRDVIERRRMWEREWKNSESDIARFTEQAEDSHKRLLQLKRDGTKLDSRLGALREDIGRVEVLQRRVEDNRRIEAEANDRVKMWQGVVNTKENERRELAGKKERLEKAEAAHYEAQQALGVYGVLEDALHRNGIPTLMLESRLPKVERYANEALAKMPGDMLLEIHTQKVSKEGNASETLDVDVTVGGTVRGYEMLSGGQKFRVDLSLRLALTRVLSSQQVDTLVVDEGFDRFQDPEGREAIMESLMAVASGFSRIIVVSHHPDVIDRFGQRIEVTMEEGVSHVA